MWGFENVGIREAKMHRTKWKYDNAGIYAPAKKKDPEMAAAKREGIFAKLKVHHQYIIKKNLKGVSLQVLYFPVWDLNLAFKSGYD
jgi:hypothetical protein